MDDLPGDDRTPLKWTPATEETFSHWSRWLNEVARGDPGHDSSDDWDSLLPALLGDSILNGGPECVHIASFSGEPVGVAVAQVAPRNGWSRITYMGLLPAWRGRGLGRWIHRHGFAMLKAQNGVLYQGGCSTENEPMLALFLEHGCKEHQVFDEWIWHAAP